MAGSDLKIDQSTLLDNIEAQQVEFTGEVDAEEYDFAVQYAVLEALSGDAPECDVEDTFRKFEDEIIEAALSALSRNSDAVPIVVSESDLE